MDVHEAIKRRRSVRKYASREIPADVMRRMREALRYAPSACNLQPWHFILITDPDVRQQLAKAAKNQMWMADAPVIVVVCVFSEHAYKHMGGHGNSAEIDAAIALDHLTLAAVSEGLGTCWIGAFREAEAEKLLEVPANAKIVAMTPLGYPASSDLNYLVDEDKRKPYGETFSVDRFGNAMQAE